MKSFDYLNVTKTLDFPIKSIHLQKQFSHHDCKRGRTYGFAGRQFWVDDGCEANFYICLNKATPVTSGTQATTSPTPSTTQSTSTTPSTTPATSPTTPSTKCSFNPCFNGATCVNDGHTVYCVCPPGYTGASCADATTTPAPSTPLPKCRYNPCFNGATCVNDGVRKYCICPPGFTGPTCYVALTECPSNPCLNDGDCFQHGSSLQCRCKYGYSGALCGSGGPCAQVQCFNGGTCQSQGFNYSCHCQPGYGGHLCDQIIPLTTKKPVVAQCVLLNKNNLGCSDTVDVVFMIATTSQDWFDLIDHEGDAVRDILNTWEAKSKNVSVAIVAYSDKVQDILSFAQYRQLGVQGSITEMRKYTEFLDHKPEMIHPSGVVDLPKALTYVESDTLKGSRPGVPKVVIPIIHTMDTGSQGHQNIITSGQSLTANQCASIIAVTISERQHSLDMGTVRQMVPQSADEHIAPFPGFYDFEKSAATLFDCHNH